MFFVSMRGLPLRIDPRPFQAALDQAKGKLAQAVAQLVQNEAQLATAKSTQFRKNIALSKA